MYTRMYISPVFSKHSHLLRTCAYNYSILRTYSLSTLKYHSYDNSMSEKDLQRQLQKLRREKLSKFDKVSPSTVTLQVLGCGAPGSPASLYVSTDHSKYLFNCGEGTQRLAHEHHLRLSKLEHVFFTTPTWKNMGGLPGMALTIQDAGVPEIKLHGPDGIIDIFDAVKRFAFLAHLTVSEANCAESTVYNDSCMTIRYVPLISTNSTCETPSDSDQSLIIQDDTDYYAHEFNKNGKRRIEQYQKRQRPLINKLPKVESSLRKITGCIAYICKLHPKSGRLNLEKCVEKGVTPGPVLGDLKAGKDVTLPDGTLIRSVDVCDPEIPGPVFIVLECPDENYVDSLISNEIFREYQSDGKIEDNWAACVVHFTPEEVLKMKKYREWMERFPKTTEHLIINGANESYSFEALHKIQHKLNLVHPTIFPIIGDSVDNSNDNVEKNDEELNLRIHRAKTLNAFHLRPLDGFDKTAEIKLNRKEDIDEAFNVDGFLDALAELQTEINAKSKALTHLPEYPKLLILGTGSCVPSKVRNTSGILLRINPETSLLFDCGEGTLGQLTRFFGKDKINGVLESIKGIYISHLHADHHLGLISILQQRQLITKYPVFLCAPKQIYSWLQIYHLKFEGINKSFNLIPNQNLILNSHKLPINIQEQLKDSLKIDQISTVEVNHCLHSFGVSVILENGQKIVYSGDTQPCNYLVDLGRDCDLLIHEATMEDSMEKEAKMKMHSTVSQAITIGQRMNSKFTVLTHFSQRYSKIPNLPNNPDDQNLLNVGIAFDNMHVSLSQLPLLPLFYPVLRILFSESLSLLEEKALKRKLKENRAVVDAR
ncbi:ribonuclease Z, mitochondrial [Fopius arisanus]|uniref:Zinc phosphodiesterase ELAC protein 2 n=1 Tax=Fopius arisanus TaxID=64838 RepID=A0A0C9R0B4_9HYME|nr:PREDICTED: ribonuclease Z, mitochondrial [Fopius arisanus]XP_011313702.1 PREDICTED: ribonuclease Z, mitochondrial [Fopius arisanus]